MDNKVTVIGVKESGKTTYLTGMYICMSMGVKNFSLFAKDPSQDMYLEKLWDMINNGDKPDPSDKTEKYKFHIAHNYKPVMDFDWMDYPGGILAQPNTPECEALIRDVKDSDCLLLILNGELFANIQAQDVAEYKECVIKKLSIDKGIREELKMFQRLSKDNVKLPPVGIVVTKCDLIPKTYQSTIQDIIRETFDQLIDASERIILPMSVTLGGKLEPGFTPNPHNVEQPIAFAVLNILMKYLLAAKIQNAQNQNYIVNHSGFLKSIFNSGKIDKAKQNSKTLGEAIDKFSGDAYELIELFSESKVIYVDGKEKNLRDYYKEAFRAVAR